jgi:sulfur-carrier protein adenylyltransferase/sulfurtransferase
MQIKQLNINDLKQLEKDNVDFQLIDVREHNEYDQVNMGAEHMPLGSIMQNEEKISKNKKVIIHCKSGVRSANAIAALQEAYGFDNLYNLEGGILAWINDKA